MKRGYQAISRAVPYVSDAVAGYLTDGVAGAVARPAARAARELLPDAFTNNRAKRRAGIPIDLPLPRGLLRDKPVNPLNGYQIQARRDAAKLAAVRGIRDDDSFDSDWDSPVSDDDAYSVRTVGGTRLCSVCYGNS